MPQGLAKSGGHALPMRPQQFIAVGNTMRWRVQRASQGVVSPVPNVGPGVGRMLAGAVWVARRGEGERYGAS